MRGGDRAAGATQPARERPRCLVEAGYGLGDVLAATPACHALWLLGLDVDFLIHRAGAEAIAALVAGHPALRRVLTNPQDVDPNDYDFGVACHGPGAAVRRIPRPLGFAVSLGDIQHHGLVGANLWVARALGFEGEPPPATLHLPVAPTVVDPRTVVVHAGSDPRATYKRWPHWEALCDRLRSLGHPLVIVGTSDDCSREGWERRHDFRLDRPLTEVAHLLRHARAFLGNDSGLGHLAGATGTPALLLFGPTDPAVFAPRSTAVHVIDAPPRPDEGRHPFAKRFPSLDRLSFEAVLEEATRWLAGARRAPPPALAARRGPPLGDPSARSPSAGEIASAPPTREAMDLLLQHATRAAVEGALARRADAACLSAWRREAARTLGAIHLRTAAVWHAQASPFARRRERSHLRLAWRLGRSPRALALRLARSLG